MAIDLGDGGVLQAGRLRWLRAVGWMALLFVGLSLVYAFVAAGVLRAELALAGIAFTTIAQAPPAARFAATLIAIAGTLAAYCAAVRWGERRRLSEFALSRMVPELIGGLAVGAGLMALTIGAMGLSGTVTVTPRPVGAIGDALVRSIDSGIVEEMLFRLVVFRLLWRAFGVWVALLVSALLFGALHLGNPNATWFAALCIALEAGIMLAAFYVLTGRAWLSIGVHAGWNFTQGWVYGAAVSGTQMFVGGPLQTKPVAGVPDALSGGGFGPEASLAGLVICTAAGLFALRLAYRRGHFIPGD